IQSFGQQTPTSRISLEDAIRLALEHNHTLKAARTQIQQNQAEEITAAIHPNPVLSWDALYIPIFNTNSTTEYDVDVGYTFERGNKRHPRIDAARDQTAVTQSQVADNERALSFAVAQQFIGVLQAKSTLDFTQQNLTSFQQTVDIAQESLRAGQSSE